MQFDHTVKRWETEWLQRDAHIRKPTKRCQVAVLSRLYVIFDITLSESEDVRCPSPLKCPCI